MEASNDPTAQEKPVFEFAVTGVKGSLFLRPMEQEITHSSNDNESDL